MVTESILNTIKKMLGIEKEFTNFDTDIITHINSVFVTLCNLGVGPEKPYAIQDSKNVWGEFTTGTSYQNIKTYIYLRVRLLFDPPSNSFAVNSFSEQIKELEWRLNVQAENEPKDCRPKEKITLIVERDLCDCKHHNRPSHKPRPKPEAPDNDDENSGENGPTTSGKIFVKPEDGKLPEVGEPNVIYLIPNGGNDPDNEYNEYYWNPELNKYELNGPAMEEMTSEEFDEMWNNAFKGD